MEAEADQSEKSAAGLTEGSLWKAIWVMSWPLVLTTVLGSVVGVVDVQVAGLIGPPAQAAVGLSEQVLFLFTIFIMSIGVGTQALVSRAHGAGAIEETLAATGQSLLLSAIVGVCLSALALVCAHVVLPLFSPSPAVVEQGRLYLSIFCLQLIPFSLLSIINGAFRAIGDARTPLAATVLSAIITIALDYLTVVGNWPVPGLGVRGIAIGATFGSLTGSLFLLWKLKGSPLAGTFFHVVPLKAPMISRLVKIGLPAACQRMSWAASVFVLFFILGHCSEPTAALASWTIGMRVEAILFMPLMALGLAVSAIVGQNLGARRIKRAFQAGWNVTFLAVGLMSILGLALYLAAVPLAELMSRDRATISHTVSYLRINALSEPFLAVAMVLAGALQGAGDTRTPMWISVFSNWLVRLPLAALLAVPLGPAGVWTAMALSVVLQGVLVGWRYQSGTWLKTRI